MKLCVIERMDNLWLSSILRAQNGSKKMHSSLNMFTRVLYLYTYKSILCILNYFQQRLLSRKKCKLK